MSAPPRRLLLVLAIAAATRSGAAGPAPASTQPATQPARLTIPTAPLEAQAAPESTKDLKGNLRRLREEYLRPPATEESLALQRAIEELKSIRVSPHRRGRTPMAATMVPGPTSRPATTQPAAAPGAGGSPTTQPAGPPELSKQVVERLKALPKARLARPVELADELYRCGYLTAAFAVYERAIKGPLDADTQSWALYQMGNCLRGKDPDKAIGLYQRLVAEHAKSLWAEPAGVEAKLLQWHKVNRPAELLEAVKPIGQPPAAAAAPTTRPAATQPATGPAVASGSQ